MCVLYVIGTILTSRATHDQTDDRRGNRYVLMLYVCIRASVTHTMYVVCLLCHDTHAHMSAGGRKYLVRGILYKVCLDPEVAPGRYLYGKECPECQSCAVLCVCVCVCVCVCMCVCMTCICDAKHMVP